MPFVSVINFRKLVLKKRGKQKIKRQKKEEKKKKFSPNGNNAWQ
jgi:hypothetical protein